MNEIKTIDDVEDLIAQISCVVPESDPAYSEEIIQERRDERDRLMYEAVDACKFLMKILAAQATKFWVVKVNDLYIREIDTFDLSYLEPQEVPLTEKLELAQRYLSATSAEYVVKMWKPELGYKAEIEEVDGDVIYTVTAVNEGSSRTWGWFSSLNKAEEAIRASNDDLIFESGTYSHVVIEETHPGLMGSAADGLPKWWWFRADYIEQENGAIDYEITALEEPPEFAKGIVGWGMG